MDNAVLEYNSFLFGLNPILIFPKYTKLFQKVIIF